MGSGRSARGQAVQFADLSEYLVLYARADIQRTSETCQERPFAIFRARGLVVGLRTMSVNDKAPAPPVIPKPYPNRTSKPVKRLQACARRRRFIGSQTYRSQSANISGEGTLLAASAEPRTLG